MVAPATKGGRRRQAAFILAPQGAHLPSGAILYNYPGRSPQTACKAQPFTGRTLAAQGRKPRRLPQPSARRAVNLREYRQAPPSLPKAHSIKSCTQQKSTNLSTSASFLISSFLSSRAASSQVLSAFVSLTTVFGMGTGVSSQLSPLNL